jgi:hypothetical protein
MNQHDGFALPLIDVMKLCTVYLDIPGSERILLRIDPGRVRFSAFDDCSFF